MNSEQKKSINSKLNVWLPNLYYVGTLITLFFIMAQVFYAKQTVVKSSEWEKAKMTIDNIERFKERISELPPEGKNSELAKFTTELWPDFTTEKGRMMADTIINTYNLLYHGDWQKIAEDAIQLLTIMDAFAYPIIMGYASEMGSFQNVNFLYHSLGNIVIPVVLNEPLGIHAKLLYRLWRVRIEQTYLKNNVNYLTANVDRMLCFEETEITPASLKRYEKKLEKELKKIQKEIEEFRKSNLQ